MRDYKMEPYFFNEEKHSGTKMSLEEFVECCETDALTDYDGIAGEIIINGYVVSETEFYPTEFLELMDEFIDLQKDKGKIEVVWYNK